MDANAPLAWHRAVALSVSLRRERIHIRVNRQSAHVSSGQERVLVHQCKTQEELETEG